MNQEFLLAVHSRETTWKVIVCFAIFINTFQVQFIDSNLARNFIYSENLVQHYVSQWGFLNMLYKKNNTIFGLQISIKTEGHSIPSISVQ